MAWLSEPDLSHAHTFLAQQASQLSLNKRTLILVGRFAVAYKGRAESILAPGDRILIVKGDGALLIHNPSGFKPVNWQPPGGALTVALNGDRLVLESRRTKPAELVRVEVERVEYVGVTRLEEAAPLELRGSEADLRDRLREKPELIEPGFVPWAKERVTERGPMDLYGEDAKGRRVIIEVKRVPAGLAEATQLWRYVEKERQKRAVDVRGILVAPRVAPRARLLLEEHGLEWKEIGLEAVPTQAQQPLAKGQNSLRAFG